MSKEIEKILKQRQKEIDDLWIEYEKKKYAIMTEELEKDFERYYPDHDGLYLDDYEDHDRVEELLRQKDKATDKIFDKYDKILGVEEFTATWSKEGIAIEKIE